MIEIKELGAFIAANRERTLTFLRNKFTTLSPEETEDVFQDASVVLYRNTCSGKIKSLTCELYTYFLRICINLSLKLTRGKNRMMMVSLVNGNATTGASTLAVERLMLENECAQNYLVTESRGKLAETILADISEKNRRLITDFYVGGLSWTDIANKYGLASADSAKNLASRCRKKLQKKYAHMASTISY